MARGLPKLSNDPKLYCRDDGIHTPASLEPYITCSTSEDRRPVVSNRW